MIYKIQTSLTVVGTKVQSKIADTKIFSAYGCDKTPGASLNPFHISGWQKEWGRRIDESLPIEVWQEEEEKKQ